METDGDASNHRLNISYNESRVLRALIEDSRRTNEEIGSETGLGRNTVSSIINGLIERGIIKNFTVNLREDDDEIVAIATVKRIDSSIKNDILEIYDLTNGDFMIVLPESYLRKKFQYTDLKIGIRHSIKSDAEKRLKLYCDYCGKEMVGEPIEIKWKKKTFYACCPNCEKDLKRKL
ncbi:MAG: TRASH domain-containing protein, partial [Thermoplasmata archaeon]